MLNQNWFPGIIVAVGLSGCGVSQLESLSFEITPSSTTPNIEQGALHQGEVERPRCCWCQDWYKECLAEPRDLEECKQVKKNCLRWCLGPAVCSPPS